MKYRGTPLTGLVSGAPADINKDYKTDEDPDENQYNDFEEEVVNTDN